MLLANLWERWTWDALGRAMLFRWSILAEGRLRLVLMLRWASHTCEYESPEEAHPLHPYFKEADHGEWLATA